MENVIQIKQEEDPIMDTDIKIESTNISENEQENKLEILSNAVQCSLCSKSYSNIGNLRRHQKSCRADSQEGRIPEENKKHGSKNSMHDQIQNEESVIQCPMCSQSFSRPRISKFINHLHEVHAAYNKLAQGEGYKFDCPLCPKLFGSKDGLHNHVINIHVQHKPFECQGCKSKNKCKRFIDQLGLDRHTKYVHRPPEVKCEICLKTFTHLYHLNKHKLSHLEVSKFKCKHCSKTFPYESLMHRHLLVKHKEKNSKVKTFTCELCGKICISSQKLESHVANVHVVDKSVECQVCGKMFVDENHLARHVKTAHIARLKAKVFTCDVCSQVFRTKPSFVRHLGVEHQRFFDCHKCSRSFGTKQDFDLHSAEVSDSPELQCYICQLFLPSPCFFSIHTKSHVKQLESTSTFTDIKFKEEKSAGVKSLLDSVPKEKRFQCDLCVKSFSQSVYLVLHRKQVHPGSKWQCKVCPKTFNLRSQLTNHERIHSLVRPWECEVCQKTFKSQGQLRDHRMIHDEVKRHKCLICHKSFSRVLGLKLHKANYHGGEKPFHCHLCDQSWAIKSHLERHLILHSTERTFGCDKCSKNFKTSQVLKKHVRMVHKRAIKKETLDCDRKTIKLEVRALVCSFCDFETQDEKEIAKHNNNQHGIPRVLLSKIKSLSFPSD